MAMVIYFRNHISVGRVGKGAEVIDEGNEIGQVGSEFVAVAVVDVTSAQIFLLLRLFPFYLGDLSLNSNGPGRLEG